MSLKMRSNDGPWPVDVFDRFFLVKGNQLNEEIAQPGNDRCHICPGLGLTHSTFRRGSDGVLCVALRCPFAGKDLTFSKLETSNPVEIPAFSVKHAVRVGPARYDIRPQYPE